jgi:hypothetical protein
LGQRNNIKKSEDKMTKIKTKAILGTILGILGLVWATLGAMPLFAAGVGNQCSGQFLFKMNIIGVDKAKNPPMTNTDRKTIFVNLGDIGSPKESNIILTQGPFMVCDANSWLPAIDCNGNTIGNLIGSVFQLPCNLNVPNLLIPCSGFSACYSVWFRALGKPGGGVTITTCGVLADGTTVCSSEGTGLISRNNGKPKFTNVTNALTSFVGCETISGVTTCGTFPLFSAGFQNFLWEYDNQGLKNGMVVFCGANCL